MLPAAGWIAYTRSAGICGSPKVTLSFLERYPAVLNTNPQTDPKVFEEHSIPLFTADLIALGGWLLINHVAPRIWPPQPLDGFPRPGLEFGVALIGAIGILVIGQLWSTAWLPSGGASIRLFVGLALAALAITTYSLLRVGADAPWILLSRIWRFEHLEEMAQVLQPRYDPIPKNNWRCFNSV